MESCRASPNVLEGSTAAVLGSLRVVENPSGFASRPDCFFHRFARGDRYGPCPENPARGQCPGNPHSRDTSVAPCGFRRSARLHHPQGAVGSGPPGPFLASRQSSRLHATSLSQALATSSRSAGKNVSPISALLRIDRYIS